MYLDVDDKQVFAATGGKSFDQSKAVVMFLSGSGLDHTFWRSYARFFADLGYAVLVPNLPGHTNSQGPALTTIAAMADWANNVVGVLDAADISLVGHSQGSLTALELASRYPARIRSVSFVASGLATPVNADLIAAAEKDPEAAIEMMLSWSFGQESAAGYSVVASGWESMIRNAPGGLLIDLKACDAYGDGSTAAAKITCPHQVILADKDRMTPHKAGMQLVDRLKNPELHVIAGSGHMLPLDAEEECRPLLHDFISARNPVRRIAG